MKAIWISMVLALSVASTGCKKKYDDTCAGNCEKQQDECDDPPFEEDECRSQCEEFEAAAKAADCVSEWDTAYACMTKDVCEEDPFTSCAEPFTAVATCLAP